MRQGRSHTRTRGNRPYDIALIGIEPQQQCLLPPPTLTRHAHAIHRYFNETTKSPDKINVRGGNKASRLPSYSHSRSSMTSHSSALIHTCSLSKPQPLPQHTSEASSSRLQRRPPASSQNCYRYPKRIKSTRSEKCIFKLLTETKNLSSTPYGQANIQGLQRAPPTDCSPHWA